MNDSLSRLLLTYNPFEPSASGIPLSAGREPYMPARWRNPLLVLLDRLTHTTGPKAFAVLGEYGSGKTYVLRWLQTWAMPGLRIQPYYFDNPRSRFYDLANEFMRQVGRTDFAKSLWEYLGPGSVSAQATLFEKSFADWSWAVRAQRCQSQATAEIARKILEKQITRDEEIAHRLGRLVVETVDRPYFEYKDFVAGRAGSLVAENEEAPYFAALVRIMGLAKGITALAFLLDEFEEIALQRTLTRRESFDYLATLKRLLNMTVAEDLWMIVAMPPQVEEVTRKLEPALWERFISQGQHQFVIPPLDEEEALGLVANRLEYARPGDAGAPHPLFPFEASFPAYLRPDILSSPRRLVKVCSIAIAEAARDPTISVPFPRPYIDAIQALLYPLADTPDEHQHDAR
ncbi:MAG: hypothetical protein ACYC5O_04055 [Anaerolineae bacterium]